MKWGLGRIYKDLMQPESVTVRRVLETQTCVLNRTQHHLSHQCFSFQIPFQSKLYYILFVNWLFCHLQGVAETKLMLFTDIFQFSEQDDLSSDSISLIINLPPPRPHHHKVLEPFSCGFTIQILNQKKLLNEPFRRKEIWLCVLGKKQDIIAFDEECFVSTSQNRSLSENKVFHAHTHYYIYVNTGRKYIHRKSHYGCCLILCSAEDGM